MFIEWTKHLKDPEAKSKLEKTIYSAKPVLDHLITILSEKEDALDRSEMDIEVYNLPNWAERQAHKNGQRSSLAFLKKLVDLDQQTKRDK